MTKIAVYPGSFDPVTYGHVHIIQRAAKIFDKVIMAVTDDNYKNTIFSLEERLNLIKACCTQKNKNIEIDVLMDYW